MTKDDRRTLFLSYILPAILFLSPVAGFFGFVFFGLMCLHIFFELGFQGFARQSRFALSRFHPKWDRFLNIVIAILPYNVFLFRSGGFIFIPVLLGLHIFSEMRSPDQSYQTKPKLYQPVWKYTAWFILYFAGLGLGYASFVIAPHGLFISNEIFG